MNKKEKIKVLIVEDSKVFSELLRVGLEKDPLIEVVDVVSDPYMARDKIIQYGPDVMTLDVELPRMNGIEFLKRLMPQYPIPVVVVSAAADRVLEMQKYGAVDFAAKPVNNSAADNFINELTVKIKIASISKLNYIKSNSPSNSNIAESTFSKINIIAVGASTGGTEALEQILRALPREMPGIVIVQHMPPVFTKMYAERLNSSCILEVKEAEDGDLVMPGRVLIAPGGSHMKVVKNKAGYSVRCLNGEKVNGHCPSVDVLFYSVAENCNNKALGIILTGMGHDGANGLLEMRKKGDKTIGQDKDSCIVYGMPKAAYELGAVEKQVSLDDIPKEMQSVLKEQNK